MRNAVVTFNAQAASARACVVKNTGEIATLTEQLTQVEEALLRFKEDCADQLFKLREELRLIEEDIEVMENITSTITCADEKVALFQCKHCKNAIMLNHIPTELSKLQSGDARSSVQQVLSLSYEESLNGKKPTALAQTAVERMSVHKFSALSDPSSDPGLNLSDVPALLPIEHLVVGWQSTISG